MFNSFTANINYLGAGINYTQNTTNHYLEIVDHINKIRRHDSGVPVLFVIEDAHKYTGIGESDALKSLVEYIYSRDIQNVGFVLLGNCAILDIFSEVIGLYDRIDMLPIQKSDLSAYIEAVFRVNNLEFRKEEFTGIVNAYNGCMLDTIKQLRSKNISFVSKNETVIRARLEGGIDI